MVDGWPLHYVTARNFLADPLLWLKAHSQITVETRELEHHYPHAFKVYSKV